MVTKKSICAVQEENRSSIEDAPDSPVSSMGEHVDCWDKSPETVLWSNAAFRTSLNSSTYSNREEDFSPRNSFCRDQVYMGTQNATQNNNPIRCLSDKSIPVNMGCHKMIKVVAQLNSPVMKQSFPHISISPPESELQLNGGKRAVFGLYNGRGMSEEEAKIKAELEKEIEKGLEEEIKDGILMLTHRLAQLHARQKARTEGYHRSNFEKPLKTSNSILDPKNSAVCCEGRRLKSPAKRPGDRNDSEKKFQKDFDWVRTLRSGAIKSNESNPRRERFRNDSPRRSRALFSEPNNERRRSLSEPRQGGQCVHPIKLFQEQDNAVPLAMKATGKFHGKPSPNSCSTEHTLIHTTQSAVYRKMGYRKGNDVGEEAMHCEVAEGNSNSKQRRLFLIDMMNKLKVSDTNFLSEQSILQKPNFSIKTGSTVNLEG